ncbi:hypothetical protein ARMGADRAFT_1086325 [Armillaria gallica]|uniref:Uncharacterized protein n=1 Tax=Armillaria gallica TaxID=47427 RepID=A0A2H3CZA8_ARMGA|nr:hypothetical protein ARMGADRAFT_1086325 [Armillaria gallica]
MQHAQLCDEQPLGSDPFHAIANLSLNLWDQDYAKTMDASEMRECSKWSWALGKTFTIQSIPELRAFFFSQALSFLLITGRHIGILEEGIILPAAPTPVILCPVACHPLYQEQDHYGGDVFKADVIPTVYQCHREEQGVVFRAYEPHLVMWTPVMSVDLLIPTVFSCSVFNHFSYFLSSANNVCLKGMIHIKQRGLHVIFIFSNGIMKMAWSLK